MKQIKIFIVLLLSVPCALVIVWVAFVLFTIIPVEHPLTLSVLALLILVTACAIAFARQKIVVAYRKNKKRYIKWAVVGSWYAIVTLLLTSVEQNARDNGYVPGHRYAESKFKFVDSLVLSPVQWHFCDEHGMNYQNPAFYTWDTLHRVNPQGFLGEIPYTRQSIDSLHRSGKKVVMAIGDSFTEGLSDGTWDSTFIRLLGKMQDKYCVFNFGVGNTDPLQYMLVTQKFILQQGLRPDLILIFFCEENDVMQHERIATPHIPTCYITNAGTLDANVSWSINCSDTAVFLGSPAETYNFYANESSLTQQSGIVAQLCAKLCITTQIYFVVTKTDDFFRCRKKTKRGNQITYRYLHAIDSICKSASIPMNIIFVPHENILLSHRHQYVFKYSSLLRDLTPRTYFPPGFQQQLHYRQRGHFNQQGNLKMAQYADSITSQKLFR